MGFHVLCNLGAHHRRAADHDGITSRATPDRLAGAIVLLRGQRVLLDRDLATLYGVETKRLNEQVRRNKQRFPADFIFPLTADEADNLRLQFATSSWGSSRSTGQLRPSGS